MKNYTKESSHELTLLSLRKKEIEEGQININ